MKTAAHFLLASSFALVACTDRAVAPGSDAGTSGTSIADMGSIVLGTYGTCVQGSWTNTPGNIVDDGSGFQTDAVVTLSESGGKLQLSYVAMSVDQSYSFSFVAFSRSGATLASTGQTLSGYSGMCPISPGDTAIFDATMTVERGVLVESAGTLYLTVQGTVTADAGTCGQLSAPSTFWITCESSPTGPPASAVPDIEATLPEAALGTYACVDSYSTYYVDAENHMEFVSAGDGGTLTLTQAGSAIVATYSGDQTVSGTLSLTANSPSTALGAAGQQLTAPCNVPIGTFTSPSTAPATLPIASAALYLSGTTATLSFTGAMGADSSCSGAQIAGTLNCTHN